MGRDQGGGVVRGRADVVRGRPLIKVGVHLSTWGNTDN